MEERWAILGVLEGQGAVIVSVIREKNKFKKELEFNTHHLFLCETSGASSASYKSLIKLGFSFLFERSIH